MHALQFELGIGRIIELKTGMVGTCISTCLCLMKLQCMTKYHRNNEEEEVVLMG